MIFVMSTRNFVCVAGFNVHLAVHEKGSKRQMGGPGRSSRGTERQHRIVCGRE